jgi:phosphonate metabolism protein PhnN/1,5-bisphosphokinase (PRPP-forming)
MLILVVGPSGAGKDTLLDAAKAALAADRRFRFVRRIVTRPAQAGWEDNEALDEITFRARRDAGAYAVWWQAHGLYYGLPVDILPDLAAGCCIVASVSRVVLTQAAARFDMRIVEITAPADILAHRLAARGREGVAERAERLSRAVPLPEGLPAQRIVNDGTVEQGAGALIALLRGFADAAGADRRHLPT